MKNKTWAETIAPYTKWLQERRGSMTRLAERMQKRTGKDKNWRQHVEIWTTSNEERQVEPLYSTGVILIEEIQALKILDAVAVAKEKEPKAAK